MGGESEYLNVTRVTQERDSERAFRNHMASISKGGAVTEPSP